MNLSRQAELYYKDIIKLCAGNIKTVHYGYSLSIITDGGDRMIDRVHGIDIEKDYQNGFVDSIVASCDVTRKMYIDTIWPARNDFKAKLIATQVTEKDTGRLLQNPIILTREYRAVLLNPIDLTQDSNSAPSGFDNGKSGADKELIQIKIQLMPIFAEELYKITYGGIFTSEPWKLLRSMLQEAIWLVTKEIPDGVDFIDPDINSKILEILIPHGTRVVDLPRYIQKNWYGIYNDGIGSYMADRHWFIYPLYRIGRWDKERHKITISIMPPAYMMDSIRSYHVNHGEVNIICAADVGQFDEIIANTYNYGDGVTVFDGEKLAHNAVEWGNGIVHLDGEKSRKEIVKSPRKNKKNYIPMATTPLVKSDVDIKSEIAARHGVVIKSTWEHSNPWLIHPGMPVKVVFWKGGVKYTVEANIMKEISTISLENGPALNRHRSITAFALHCDPTTIETIDASTADTKGVSGSLLDGLRRLF